MGKSQTAQGDQAQKVGIYFLFHLLTFIVMSSIKLNFINESKDQNNSRILIFQKNVSTDLNQFVVAWKVISNCGTGWHHPFTFDEQLYLGASDAWGNQLVDPIAADNGDLFHVYQTGSGSGIQFSSPSPSKQEIQLRNDAIVYRNGKIIGTKTGISPGQKAAFSFQPTIWIGVVSQIEIDEGDIIDSAIITDINTSLNLKGIASADIVMTGGGVGPNAVPFAFTLQNVQYAA